MAGTVRWLFSFKHIDYAWDNIVEDKSVCLRDTQVCSVGSCIFNLVCINFLHVCM